MSPICTIHFKSLKFIDFKVKQGLEALRQLIPLAEKELVGIRLIGDVGITSHFGDILRKAKIPSRISRD